MIQKKRLHLGCGLNTPEGWINLDGSWNVWLAKYPIVHKVFENLALLSKDQLTIPWNPVTLIHDLRKPLPFADNSLLAITASHVLEHLYLEEARRLLKRCCRVLEPGGVLRVVVPDLESIIGEYLEADSFADSGGVKPDHSCPEKFFHQRQRISDAWCVVHNAAKPQPRIEHGSYRLYGSTRIQNKK